MQSPDELRALDLQQWTDPGGCLSMIGGRSTAANILAEPPPPKRGSYRIASIDPPMGRR
jgi:hypothetical protein